MHEKMTSNQKITYVGIGTVVFLLIIGFIIFYFPNTFEESPKFITVSKGQTFTSVAETLEARGIIQSVFTFKVAGTLLGVTQRLRVGKYSFASGISNLDILEDMEGGYSTVNAKVVLLEGLRTKQFSKILKREVGIDTATFLRLIKDTSLIGIYPHNASSLEGYLMPDTYEFYWQEDEEAIVKRLITEFREFFTDSLQQRMKELDMDLNEVMTMASIVEGEALYDDERPIIAGVYYNRLRKRMRLQADPTVLYAVSEGSRRLTRADLRVESPYNTYLRYGLPPGPINNPGRASILAALYPDHHSFLYFVSDANGRHRFSRNYEDHRKNVRLYRKARAAQNG